MREFNYDIGAEDAGGTVGDYLKRGAGLSSRLIVRLKHDPMGLLLNGAHIRTIDRLSKGDRLTVTIRDGENRSSLCDVPVPVLYEDEDVIVFNKPAAMACHQAKRYQDCTLANVFAYHCAQKGENAAFRAVNRLDRDTSGAVVVAKNAHAAACLSGRVDKAYIGIVTGNLRGRGSVAAPILRPNPRYTIRSVGEGGQSAGTDYQVLQNRKDYAVVRFRLRTGRTHQIRVHMAWIGHPLAGDDMYGGDTALIGRQALHCEWVEFSHPVTGAKLRVHAELDQDMQKIIDAPYG